MSWGIYCLSHFPLLIVWAVAAFLYLSPLPKALAIAGVVITALSCPFRTLLAVANP